MKEPVCRTAPANDGRGGGRAWCAAGGAHPLYEGGLVASVEEFLAILRSGEASGLLSHLQVAGRPYWGSVPRAIDRLEAARREGVDVSFDMYLTAGSSTILQLLPPSAQEGGVDALLVRLARMPTGRALRRAVEEGEAPTDPGWESKVRLIGWENIRIGGVAESVPEPIEGRSLAEIAADKAKAPFELLLYPVMERDRGHYQHRHVPAR